MVRNGYVPARGVLRDIFGYALQSRLLKVPKNHPLYEYFQEEIPDTYGLSNTMLAWFWSYLSKTEPKNIVEVGSGRSTVVLAFYVQKQLQDGKSKPVVISIESEEKWLARTRENLDKFNLTGMINFIHCNLINNSGNDNIPHGYDINNEKLDLLLAGNDINLLLIDGPSGGHGRGATLPSVADRLAINADIYLDDASRNAEQSTINNWLSIFNKRLVLHGVLPLGSGLAWMRTVDKLQYKSEKN